jgi:uncharacterized protein YjdB
VKKAMEKRFKNKITTGMLLLLMVLSIFFATGVFAANEEAAKTATAEIGVAYRGHVQNQGNMPKPEGDMVAGPEPLGTRGQSLRVEGFWIALTGDVPEGANIVYEVHVQNEGWMTPEKNGTFAGTTGESQRVESIKIQLENLPGYDVYYRGHVQNVGDIPQVDGEWGWKKNGEDLGTTGSSLRLEELQVKIVKQADTPDNDTSIAYNKAGTYGPKTGTEVIENDVTIDTPDVVLQNLHIKGNLTIGEGVGEGDVTLNNITVDGETYIRGGGKNSIHINGGDYNKITIQQTSSGQVRIVATNAAGLEVVVSEDAKGEDIILEGAFENVQIDAPDVKISTQGDTTIKDMVVGKSSTGSEITLDKDTTVNKIDLNASVDMKGEGTIEKANVNSDDVTFEQKPVEETVAPEVTVPPVVTPPTPPPPTNPPAEDRVVKAFNQEKSADMMVNLLELHAAAFDLTGFENLDYSGRLIVGDYLLKKDGFSNRSVLQVAITEGIKLAKDDPDARKYIEAATAYTPSISFQDDNSLLIDYSNSPISGAQKSLLNGLYADFSVCLETPLADGEAFELTVSGTTKRITNKEMPGRQILLSKLMGRTLASTDLVENQKARMTVKVKDISIKAEQYLTFYPCTTRNGVEYCRNFSNAHGLRVTRYWIEAFVDEFSMQYQDSGFLLNYGTSYTAEVRKQLANCYTDLELQLYRKLEPGESITLTVNETDYTIDDKTEMNNVNKTGIRLSELMGGVLTRASELSGQQVIAVKSYQFNTPNGIDANAVLCKQDGEVFYILSCAGTSLYPDWLKTYTESVSFSSEENKMTLNYGGKLLPAVTDCLGDYRADVMISFNRGLDEGETLTITAFGKPMSFKQDEIAAMVENGNQLRLSKLMDVEAGLAKSKEGSDEISFELSGLDRNIYIFTQAVLVKDDACIYLDGLSDYLSLFETNFQAYADSIELQSEENKFTVTYAGNLSDDVKTKLAGYYADAIIYTDRPLKEGEEVIVTAFGRNIPVTRGTFENVWGTSIRLSDLLGLELNADQLAVKQKGSFEIKVKEDNLTEQLNISASAILVKGDDIEYINKSTGMSLTPKEFEVFDGSVELITDSKNQFTVRYNGVLSTDVQGDLAGLYADPLLNFDRSLKNDESITIGAYGKTAVITSAVLKQYSGRSIGLTELLPVDLDKTLLAASKTGDVKIDIIAANLKTPANITVWKGLIDGDKRWVYRSNDGIGFTLLPDAFEAYKNNMTLIAEDNKFAVTYGNLLSQTEKDVLNGYYSDAFISLSRPLETDEAVKVLAFGQEIPVDANSFTNNDSTQIRLSQLLGITPDNEQLAGNQAGGFDIVITEQTLKSDLTIYADAILVRDDMFYYLDKMADIGLEPVLNNAKAITATTVGTLNSGNNGDYIAVPAGTRVSDLKAGLTVSDQASVEILASTGGTAVIDQESTEVTSLMVILVTAEDQSTTEYSISVLPQVQNGPFVGNATVVLKDSPAKALDGTTGIIFLERYDVIDYLVFEMINYQNALPVPQKVILSENPVLKISVDGALCEYGKIEYADATQTKIKITPSSEAMAKLDKLGYFAFNVPKGTITDEAGNPVRSMVGNYLSGTLATPLLKVTDSVKPFINGITATVDGNPVNAIKNETTGIYELAVAQNSVTSEIRVQMNEPVTVSNGVDILVPVTETAYGTVKTDANDSSVVVITPASTEIGTAGNLGLTTFSIPENLVCDLVDNDSSNIEFPSSITFEGGGLGNAQTSFNLNVVVP